MKPSIARIRRIFLLVGTMVVWFHSILAQKPEIKSLSATSGSMGETVTIKGSFFGTDATKLAVTFGASKGVIKTVTDQQIEVAVPYGSLYTRVSVTNTATGLTGFSNGQFLLNFSGNGGFDPDNLQTQQDFPAGAPVTEGLHDMCMCDFDGDKRVDVAATNDNSGFLTIVSNGSSPGTINFPVKFASNIASRSLHIKCGDLNGDGKPDIVATESGTADKVFIIKNNSTGPGNFAFTAPAIITLPGKKPRRIEIADLDLNGKPDVMISSLATNTISILINQSTLTSIAFSPSPPITISVPGAASTEALGAQDLDGDGLPEIVTAQYQVNSDLYIIENKSSPGAISMGAVKSVAAGTVIKTLRIADLDGDQKSDIAYTKLNNAEVGLFLNQSTPGSLSFSAAPAVSTDATPWGLDFGDLDGDGKPEIVAASATKKSITVLKNNSTAGSLNFTRFIKGTTYINRHIGICDLDGDGKPDVAFTSVDDVNLNVAASKISVFRNKACMKPQLKPEGPLNVCAGYALTLTSTLSGGATYAWTNATTSTTVTGTNEFSPTVSGDYYVTATAESGTCSLVSNTVKVTISPGTAADPAPTNNGPVCIGNTLTLTATDVGPGFTYQWRGPGGYTGTGITPASVSNFQASQAGTYYVDVVASSGCVARTEETLVVAVDLPDFKVAFTGSALICQPDFKSLTVYPSVPGFTYQWYEKTGGAISGATSTSLLRNTSGEYYYRATSSNPGCPVTESAHTTLTVVTPPVAAFTTVTTACKGEEVSFTNQSTFDPQSTLSYSWAFGDGQSSTEKNPKHIYATSSTFSITLTAAYPSNACPNVATKAITITEAPAAVIATAGGKFEICPDATIVLSLTNTFGSYLWNTGETTPTIVAKKTGEYSVDVTATNGCKLKAVQEVSALSVPEVTATATPETVNEGESVQLVAEGLLTYAWSPVETVTEPDKASTTATPLVSTTYTVAGAGANGCKNSTTVDVKVRGDVLVNKLEPANFFSPNGDATGQYWNVENIEEYPQCGVIIYDDKGVKVYEAKPYLNNWEGTFTSGRQVPDGVYYYIIRCDGEEGSPKTGSITVLR
ncbi:FG-GAP-like repeat-containing protein [Chryseolinea sp. T2]|uniref:FG-GAP-like repeat-containing protein n=1 Tax=Chryseolinea sp. T2 TaxID=3129255 RepID=UPI003077F271